ncbi:uncharacterized protein LOC144339997 [Macaca mulatta]
MKYIYIYQPIIHTGTCGTPNLRTSCAGGGARKAAESCWVLEEKRKHQGFCTGSRRFCSTVTKPLAQRYTAESLGSEGWIFRVAKDASGISAENRSLGIPESSREALLRAWDFGRLQRPLGLWEKQVEDELRRQPGGPPQGCSPRIPRALQIPVDHSAVLWPISEVSSLFILQWPKECWEVSAE